MPTVNELVNSAIIEVVKAIAKSAGESGIQLLASIRARFQKDEKAQRSLTNLELDPSDDDHLDIFKKHLNRILEKDVAFREQLANLILEPSQQSIIATGNSMIDNAAQISEGGNNIQRIEASDGSVISGVKQQKHA